MRWLIWIVSRSFLSLDFTLPIILICYRNYKYNLIYKNVSTSSSSTLKIFFIFSGQFQSGLPVVECYQSLLYLPSPETCLHVVNMFFITNETAIICFHCIPWCSSPLHVVELTSTFFLRMHHIAELDTHSLMMASFICITISSDFILIAPLKQISNTNSTPGTISRLFNLHNCLDVMRERATSGHETA